MQKLAVSLGGAGVGPQLAAMNPGGWLVDIAPIPGGEIGVISHPHAPVLQRAGIGPGLLRRGDDVLAFSGLPLSPAAIAGLTEAAALPATLKSVDGAFAAIGWSARDKKLIVACDFLGLQPLYYACDSGVQIATETKAFRYDPDPAGWSAWLTSGHVMGDVTLTRHAKRFGPGAYGSFGVDGLPTLDRTWQWPTDGGPPKPAKLVDQLAANVRDYAAVAEDAICLLSGGFDSRLILGLLLRERIPTRALIVRHEDQYGDQDGLLAELVARATGVSYEVATPDTDFFSTTAYVDYVWANEVGIPSMDLFIAKVFAHLDGPPVWEGLIPAHTLRTVHQPQPGTFTAFLRHECASDTSAIWRAAQALFVPAFYQDLRDAFAHLFASTRARYPDDSYGLWQWLIEHRMRNRTGPNPAKVYANRAAPLMVGTAQEFWRDVARLPYESRANFQFYLDLFSQAFPQLMTIPFDSSGDVYAGPAARLAGLRWRLRQRALTFFEQRPNLAKQLGLHVHPHLRAQTLLRAIAAEDEDALLNSDALRRLRDNPGTDKAMEQLLFHWRAARWAHEGQLYTKLLRRP